MEGMNLEFIKIIYYFIFESPCISDELIAPQDVVWLTQNLLLIYQS